MFRGVAWQYNITIVVATIEGTRIERRVRPTHPPTIIAPPKITSKNRIVQKPQIISCLVST